MELLFFDATWTSVGRLIRPMVRRLAAAHGLPLTILRVDRHPELTRQYGLSSLPETLLVERGAILQRWVGFRSEYELRREVEEALHLHTTESSLD